MPNFSGIRGRSFRRNKPHSNIEIVPEGGTVSITGDLTVTGTITGNSVVDGGAAVVLTDDFSAAGTSKTPLIATDKSDDKIGFFGATPVVQRTTYTQTYSTADRTHANPTAAVLTVADGAGTNDNTIGAITDNTTTIAAVQELADEINKLVADVADVKQAINAIIDDLQALGFVA